MKAGDLKSNNRQETTRRVQVSPNQPTGPNHDPQPYQGDESRIKSG